MVPNDKKSIPIAADFSVKVCVIRPEIPVNEYAKQMPMLNRVKGKRSGHQVI